MSSAPDALATHKGEICIDASQLRPGVHVRLPVGWMDHPFMFNSFVIADEEQARLVAALKLPQLFCNPARCKVPPRPRKEAATAPEDPQSAAEQQQLAALAATRMAEKRETAPVMPAATVPLAPQSAVEPQSTAEQQELAALAAMCMAEQHDPAQVMRELRGRLDKAQVHYIGATKAVGGAIKGFSANPREAIKELTTVSQETATALLADPDSAIQLIAEMAHDDGQAAHALSVMTLAQLLGKEARLPEQALRALGVGALLHDIGKLGINSSILRSQERNRQQEAIYQTHCRLGYDQAGRAGGLSQPMLDVILRHHERCDGSGFPDRLSIGEIPLAARIVAIADRFDNLVNPIDSRCMMSPSEVLSRLWAKEKKAFDPVLLQLFVRAMGVYPPGSIVQLSDGRTGAVVSSAPADKRLSPKVMIYAAEVPRAQAIIIDLARDDSIKVERPLRLQERPAEELNYLLPRRNLSWSYMAESVSAVG